MLLFRDLSLVLHVEYLRRAFAIQHDIVFAHLLSQLEQEFSYIVKEFLKQKRKKPLPKRRRNKLRSASLSANCFCKASTFFLSESLPANNDSYLKKNKKKISVRR